MEKHLEKSRIGIVISTIRDGRFGDKPVFRMNYQRLKESAELRKE